MVLAISLGGLSGANEVQTALSAVRGVYRARASSLPRAVWPASNPSASIELGTVSGFAQPSYRRLTSLLAGRGIMR